MSYIKRTRLNKNVDLKEDGWIYIGKIGKKKKRLTESLSQKIPTDEYCLLISEPLPTYPCLFLIVVDNEIYNLGRNIRGFASRFSSGYQNITPSEMDSLYGNSARINNAINQYDKDNLQTELFLKDASDLTEDEIIDLQDSLYDRYDQPIGVMRRPKAQ